MKKPISIIVFLFCISVVGLGLFLYFTTDISCNDSFYSFNNYFLSIATTIVLGYIAYLGYYSINKFNQLQIKPVLFGYISKTSFWDNKEQFTWHIKNASHYPAMNIYVTYSIHGKFFSKPVSCGCVNGNDNIELFFVPGIKVLKLYFSDLQTEKYYIVTIENNISNQKSILKKEYDLIVSTSTINTLMLTDIIKSNSMFSKIREFQLLYLFDNISHKKDSHMLSIVNYEKNNLNQ
ncbi:MAG TPA: hypothetical protein DF637_01405 [Rikenellaceae bacterium]|nr:hypothetical protein [Rikenellaceae bacterium]